MRYVPLALLGAALVTACGGDNLMLPPLGPASPAKLGMAVQPPASAKAGARLDPGPQVQVLDSMGTPVKQAGLAVTVALDASGAQLEGQRTQPTDSTGIATFGDLAIDGPAGQYTLRFSAAGLKPTTTRAIDVAALQVATTTSIVRISPDRGTALSPVTVTFRVTSTGTDTPPGTVRVAAGGDGCSAATTVGSCSFVPATGGAKTITASYAGSDGYEASDASASYQVDRVPSTTSAPDVSPNRIVPNGTNLTLTTRVTTPAGTPDGTVTFAQDACGSSGTALGGPVPVGSAGTASLGIRPTDPGTILIVACYGGSPTFEPSASGSSAVLVLPF
jgi:hypothetical protein